MNAPEAWTGTVATAAGNSRALGAYALSAALGALIGLERQWSESRSGQVGDHPGMRTFVLWTVVGTAAAQIGSHFSAGLFPVAFVMMLVCAVAAGFQGRKDGEQSGLTSLAALSLAFLLGGLVFWGERRLALVLAGGTFLVLATKKGTHAFSEHFDERDKRSFLQFLLISAVILPVVPNADFGPYGAFNPFKTWLMVVLVTGLGLVSYAGIRILGPKAGLGLTGLLGGLVSSTAATLALSRQDRSVPGNGAAYAWATIIACTFLYARIAVLLGFVSPGLLEAVWSALLALASPGIAYGAWKTFLGSHKESSKEIKIHNPSSLRVALVFAALYALITLLVKSSSERMGEGGIGLASFVSGLTDMDAIALALGVMVSDHGLSGDAARVGIVLAALGNTVFKAGLALFIGKSPGFRIPILLIFGVTLVIGVLLLGWHYVF